MFQSLLRQPSPARPRQGRLPALLCAGLLGALAALPGFAQGSVAEILRQYGVRPIDPPAPASNFTLPSLVGPEQSLSDFHGSWVVLTFFATWCGPCRSELPTLETLHRERGSDGLVILGVSIDDDRGPLGPFVRQLGLTFPILWDTNKQAAAAYRASSIPLTYLVDPAGRLAGISRGARDWAELAPMLAAVLAAHPAEPGAGPSPETYADAGAPVATPTVSDPPTGEVVLSDSTPTVGEPFELQIRMRWSGSFDEYLPHPPHVELPEGILRDNVTAETDSRAGRNEVIYRVALRAEEPGAYALDPVELRYTPRFEAQPVAGRVLGPTVEIQAPSILGLAPGVFAVALGGTAVLGVGLLWGLRRWRRRSSPSAAPEAALHAKLSERWDEARRLRMQGDGAGYLVALAALDAELRETLNETPAEDAGALAEAVERARFGGQAPPAGDLDNLARQVERRLETLRPDPDAKARADVLLRDES